MSEPKAFASLSSGLLARKGAARPAMRPQGFGQVGAGLDDLGWNDMGFEAPKPALAPVRDDRHDAFGDQLSEPALRNPLAALTPSGLSPSLSSAASPVHDQQAEIADRFAGYTEESSDDEEIDETAELYDPAAEAAGVSEEDEGEDSLVLDAPVLAIKPPRAVIMPPAPMVAAPAPAPAAIVEIRAAPVRAPRPRAEAGSKPKAAFTLRLDGQRHLKLRLACAVTGRSAQQLVTEALDRLLADMPELDSMADRAPRNQAPR